MPLSDFYESMKGWVPAQTPPEPKPQIPDHTTQVSGYLRTTLPLPLQYSPDTLKQYNRPGMSSFRIAPTPPSGVPAINSASSGVSQTSINTFSSIAAAGVNGSVQFNSGGGLGGNNQFVWNNTTSTLNITGSLTLTTPLGIAFGGTGTATPSLVAGPDITITGSWPNNTIAVKVQAGVVAGSYTSTNLTVDAQGIITAIANGSGSSISAVNLTAQTANVAATNLVASASAGTYLVTVYLVVSQAATTSSTLPDSRIIFTDQDSGAVITVPLTTALSTNGLTTFSQTTLIVNAKATTSIQYDIGQITPYASSGATPMQFAYHARATFLS